MWILIVGTHLHDRAGSQLVNVRLTILQATVVRELMVT